MKKLITICMFLGALTGVRGENTHMLFRSSDGIVQSIPAENLVMTFSDGQLHAVAGSESIEVPLASLQAMYFGDLSAVALFETGDTFGPVTVYTTDGMTRGAYDSLSNAHASLPRGLYIVKDTKGSTRKIAVTK